MKKTLLLFATPLLLAGSLEERMQAAEDRLAQLGGQTAMGTYGANTLSAREETAHNWGAHFDLLYWHTKQQAPNYAETKSVANTDFVPNVGTLCFNDFSWSFGFRTGLTYNLPYDKWEADLSYTRVHFSSHAHTDPGSSLVFASLAATEVSTTWEDPIAASATDSVSIHYQTAALDIGRHYFISNTLSVRPSFGAKALWLSRTFKTVYAGSSVNNEVGNVLRFLPDEKVHGVGPHCSLHTGWHLLQGWEVSADGGLALPFCYVRATNIFTGSDDALTILDRDAKHSVVPNAMLRLGLAYNHRFSQANRSLRLSLGYESQFYWINSTPNVALFALYGLTAKAQVNF